MSERQAPWYRKYAADQAPRASGAVDERGAARRRVLVLEDEVNIRDLVCLHLRLEGLECVEAGDGHEALRIARSEPLDLIVLDVMVPGLDGLTVCRAIRRGGLNADVPVLMLTARREEADTVLGLESGADDYLTKPFGVRELMARVHALLRRAARSPGEETTAESPPFPGGPGARPLAIHGVDIDPARQRVSVRGADVELTRHELSLLYILASNPGIVFTREALLERVWREGTFVTLRSVDALVKRLRRKIEVDPGHPRLVETVRSAGYRFAERRSDAD